MNKSNQLIGLMRTCAICKQEKSLMLFLEAGNTYGNICINCKGTGEEDDHHGSTSKGLRIDDKALVFAELEQQRKKKEAKEQAREEFLLKEKKLEDKLHQKEKITHFEKKLREFHDTKKSIFTDAKKTKQAKPSGAPDKDKGKANLEKDRYTQEAIGKEAMGREESAKTTVDLSAPYYSPHTTQIKHTSTFMQALKQRLGPSAFIRRYEQIYQKGTAPKDSSIILGDSPDETLTDDTVEKMEKTFGPSSRR